MKWRWSSIGAVDGKGEEEVRRSGLYEGLLSVGISEKNNKKPLGRSCMQERMSESL